MWVADSRLSGVTLQQFDCLVNLSFPLLLDLVKFMPFQVGVKFICGKSGKSGSQVHLWEKWVTAAREGSGRSRVCGDSAAPAA